MTKKKTRTRIAWGVLIASIIGWPVSAFTFAASEPQSVLALSWISIILTCTLIVIEV